MSGIEIDPLEVMSLPKAVTVVKKKEENPIGYFELYRSKGTVRELTSTLSIYLGAVTGVKPTHLQEACTKYLGERGKELAAYQLDVERFFVSMKELAPMTKTARLSLVRTFLMRNGIEFKELFWKDLRRKNRGATRPVTIDDVPTNETLRKVAEHLPTHGRAFMLLLASSGMRIGEALKIQLMDIDLNNDPLRIRIRAEYTKGNMARTVFASRETKESLVQWLRVRERYLDQAVKKSVSRIVEVNGQKIERFGKSDIDTRLFPFEESTVRQIWLNAVTKAGFYVADPRTEIMTLHPHVLRKFWRTKVGTLMPQDISEAIMGHSDKLVQTYARYTVDQLADFYKKAEAAVWIFSETGAEIAEARQKIDELSVGLSIQIARLTKENQELHDSIGKVREEVLKELEPQIKERVEEMVKEVLSMERDANAKAGKDVYRVTGVKVTVTD